MAAGLYALFGGSVTLVGWALDIQRLTDWRGHGISMLPNAAACAVLGGLAVGLDAFHGKRRHAAQRALGLAVAVIGGMTLIEHVSGQDLGIDSLLFDRTWGQRATVAPMRMGPPASTCYLMIGMAMWLSTLGARARAVSAGLGLVVAAVAALSLTGYLYRAEPMYTLALTGIAMQTASIVFTLGIALVARVPERGPMRVITERTAAGMLARRTLPIVVAVAVGLGSFQLFLQQQRVVDPTFGTAVRTLLEIFLLIGLLWQAVRMLRGHERALRQTEAEVRRQADQLAGLLTEQKQASRAKDKFLAMLAHELRNPLAAVHNALAAARLDAESAPRALEIARQATTQLTRLVDDLLDVTRITRGQITLRNATVSLNEVVERTLESTRPLFEQRCVALTAAVSDRSIEVNGDAARLEQVVGNLLTNAAKYTDPGGEVAVILQHAEGHAVLRIRDNGIGIPPELLPRIFDLFFQADQALDRTRGGLGIGLTVVKELVEMHGGRVEAHSEGVGRGSELIVRLPEELRVPQPSAPANLALESRCALPAQVLIAEDNAQAAESLAMLLQLLGFRVCLCADGPSALDAARSNPPDVMLVDIGLPGMHGYELAGRIRREPVLRDVALVALTGYGQEEDRRRALAAGFDHHLVKPVEPQKLEDLLCALTRPNDPSATGSSSSPEGPGTDEIPLPASPRNSGTSSRPDQKITNGVAPTALRRCRYS